MKTIYLFSGNDLYEINKRIKEISSNLAKDYNLEVNEKKFDIKTVTDFLNLRDDITLIPLFKDIKLYVFYFDQKLLKIKEKELEELIDMLNVLPLNNHYIFVICFEKYTKVVKNSFYDSLFFKTIVKKSQFEEFEKLYSWQEENIKKKIIDLSLEYNLIFQEDALNLFLSFIKDNLENLDVELKKLQTYLLPLNVVNSDVIEKIYLNNFDLNKLFSYIVNSHSKNKNNFYNVEQKLINFKSPLYIIASLQNKFREAMQIKLLTNQGKNIYAISKELGVSSYKLKHNLNLVRDISEEDLKKILLKLSEIEYKIKTGFVKQENAMDLILISV